MMEAWADGRYRDRDLEQQALGSIAALNFVLTYFDYDEEGISE